MTYKRYRFASISHEHEVMIQYFTVSFVVMGEDKHGNKTSGNHRFRCTRYYVR